MSGLIWIQTVWHSDRIPEINFLAPHPTPQKKTPPQNNKKQQQFFEESTLTSHNKAEKFAFL